MLWTIGFSSIKTYKGRRSFRFNRIALSCVLLHGLQEIWKSAHSQQNVMDMFQRSIGVEKRSIRPAALHAPGSQAPSSRMSSRPPQWVESDHQRLQRPWACELMKPRLPFTEAKSKGHLCLKSFSKNMNPFYRLHMHPPIYIQIQLCAYLTRGDCSRTSTSPAANAKRWFSGAGFSGPPRTIPHVCLDLRSKLEDAIAPWNRLILTSLSVHFGMSWVF